MEGYFLTLTDVVVTTSSCAYVTVPAFKDGAALSFSKSVSSVCASSFLSFPSSGLSFPAVLSSSVLFCALSLFSLSSYFSVVIGSFRLGAFSFPAQPPSNRKNSIIKIKVKLYFFIHFPFSLILFRLQHVLLISLYCPGRSREPRL